MHVLIACEESGIVRQAFRERGHDAWSCDLLPARDGSPYHLQIDVRNVIHDPWDLVIAHPPCDHMSNAGARWEKSEDDINHAVEFFWLCYNANAPRVAVENPVMNRKRTGIRKPDFSVQPWHFGDNEAKRTCFWTRGLPPLKPDVTVKPDNVKQSTWRMAPGPNRKRDRSTTFPGIALAMARQWG